MPLIKSASRAAVSQNIRQLRSDKYPQNQAVAIALDVARRAKRRAEGGEVDPLTGAVTPSDQAQGKFGRVADAVVGGLRNWIETPGRAMREGITTDQAVDWAAPTAMGTMGVGTPNAMTGAVGTFGGRLAKTANLNALAKAEEMAAKGTSKDQIWNDTGWFRGADQKWRFEIPDNAAQMNPNTYSKGTSLPEVGQSSPVAGELWHKDLYDAYPDMRNVKARVQAGNNNGRYLPEGTEGSSPAIQVNASTPAAARSVAIHELQHDIQAREGFAKGSNLAQGRDAYQRSAGEVEAHNVQRRLFLSPEQRRQVPPWATESYPRDQQIVNMDYPGIIDILRKYGLAGAIPAAGVAAAQSNERAKGGSVNPALDVAYRVKREGRAMGGIPPTPWQVRNEARAMTHSGPIMSAVPGRTDNHPMSVAPGSYIVNADTVSHIGQNNTNAGHAVLSQMFGRSGPFGTPPARIARGRGAPPAPKPMRADGGPADGDGPVDILAAGGEFVVEPDIVANIGGGDLKRGHEILDYWMKQQRKDHIRTLKKLPGPAKD